MKNHKRHILESLKKPILLLLLTLSWAIGSSQMESEVIAVDLRNPSGIELDAQGNLWIAETGTGNNDAAITVLWADGGQERIIDGLPSTFDTTTMTVDGAHRLQSLGPDYFAVLLDEGSSEIGSQILVYHRAVFTPGAALTATDAVHAIRVGEQMEPLGYASNAFSFVIQGCDLYIADAAANAIIKRDGLSGVVEVLTDLAPKPNPLPYGPPVIESVPTRIMENPSGGFLVSEFTGFPFADGAADILAIDVDGEVTTYDSSFTLLTDMHPASDGDGVYLLQYASFRPDSLPPWVFGSSMIIQRKDDGLRDTLATGFGPSAGMAIGDDGDIYVTNLFFGNVVKLTPSATTSNRDHQVSPALQLAVTPNPGQGQTRVSWHQPASGVVTLEILNSIGQKVLSKSLGTRQIGLQREELDASFTQNLPSGYYAIRISSQGADAAILWLRR